MASSIVERSLSRLKLRAPVLELERRDELAISSTFVVRFRHSHPDGGTEMLRQDNPVVGGVRPPRALPIRYLLAWKVGRVRCRVRKSWRNGTTAWVFAGVLAEVVLSLLVLGHLGS